MCWQCITRPSIYLKALGDLFKHGGWYFGPGCGNGVYEFALDGQVWHTNPVADIDFMGESLPGDADPEGIPYFLEGKFAPPATSVFQEDFAAAGSPK